MNITIESIEREIVGSETNLIVVSFLSAFSGQSYKITSEGLFFNNPRITKKKIDIPPSGSTAKKPLIQNEKYGYEPLRLVSSDLQSIKEITAHWETIQDKFIRLISEGHSWSGHISTEYFFPDGTKKIWYAERFREQHPNSLENYLKHERGKSWDTRFPSAFCEYIENVPFLQHYQHGRLDYFLEHDVISLQDDKTIQEVRNPRELLEVLAFYAVNPETAARRLVFGE
ncbi:MAG: hypothetical protein AABW48_05550 [Nanoarchaeota archaeon]